MSLAYFSIIIYFTCASVVHSRSYNTGLIFYDLKSQRAFLPPTVSVSRGRALNSVQYSDKGSIWSTFGKPCECQGLLCGCCAGLKVNQFNFDQKMCANVTYSQKKERILMEVFLNQQPASRYGISARNPSPLCIPIMMPIPMAMCIQMKDIAIKGNNLNMCMDFVVRLASTELFEMHFQCMSMGLDGIQYVDKDGNPVIPAGSVKTNDNEYEYYDETSSDVKRVDEQESEGDDNVIDNVIEIDDYDRKSYKDHMNDHKTDDTIKQESLTETETKNEDIAVAETETDAEEDNAKEEETLIDENEQESVYEEEQINFGNNKEDELMEEESQTEAHEVPMPMTTADNEFNYTPFEGDVMTTTMKGYDSETPLNEVITTEFTEVNVLESTTQIFTDMPNIMTDNPTQSDLDIVNETRFSMNNKTGHTNATEDPDLKILEVSNITAQPAHEYVHAEIMPSHVNSNLSMVTSATVSAFDLNLVSKVSKEEPATLSTVARVSTVTLKPKASRMLSGKRVRKAKPKRKETENPITMFRRLFDFF